MKIRFHKHFEKQYKKLQKRDQRRVRERLLLFLQDEFNPILNNHPLTGKYRGYRSINVRGDLRMVYKRIPRDIHVFVAVGTHPQLYR